MNPPPGELDGLTIIVTRPRQQAEGLKRAFEKKSAAVIVFPAAEIEPLRPSAKQRRQLETLAPGDWAVFTSTNAVTHGLIWFTDGRVPAGVNVVAVGGATATALRRRGTKNVLVPGTASSEGLIELLTAERVRNREVAIVKGKGGRRLLSRVLRQRGAHVHSIPVYRRERPVVALNELGERLPKRGRIVTTVTSGELLNNLIHMMDAATLQRLQRAPLVAVSERVAGLARWIGFRRVAVADGPGPAAIARAVAQFQDERR